MSSRLSKIIECPCGAIIEAPSEDEAVARAQEHASKTHGMDLTREQALAMARPA